jgi:hypothetical protein
LIGDPNHVSEASPLCFQEAKKPRIQEAAISRRLSLFDNAFLVAMPTSVVYRSNASAH